MSIRITPESDPQALARRLTGGPDAASLRSSEARRRLLERWADVLTDAELSVDFTNEEGQTAHVTLGDRHPEIVIPSWEIDQPLTELDREPYDLLIQRTLTLHEVGHILFTDGEALTKAKQSLPAAEHDIFHMMFNALEDGAIEEQLRQEYEVAGDIEFTNANFRYQYEDGTRVYNLLQATQTACLNLAVYDSGHLSDLLDESKSDARFDEDSTRDVFESEVLPEIRSAVTDVLAEPDPEKRVDRILELWKEIRDHFTDYDFPDDEAAPETDLNPQTVGDGTDADGLSSTDKDAVSDHAERVVDGNADSPTPDTGGETQNGSENDSEDHDGGDSSDNKSSSGPSSDDHSTNSDTTRSGTGRENTDTEQDGNTASNESDTASEDGSKQTGDGSEDVDSPDRTENDLGGKTDSSDESGGTNQTNDKADSDDDTSTDTEERMAPSSGDETEISDDRGSELDPNTEQEDGPEQRGLDQDRSESEEQTSASKSGGTSSGSGRLDTDSDVPTPGDEDGTRDPTEGGDHDDQGTPEEKKSEDQPTETEIERRYNRLLDRQRRSEEEDRREYEDAIGEYADVLDKLQRDGLEPSELEVADGDERRQGGWSTIRRESNQLKRILEQQFQQERRSKQRRGRRSGHLDSRSLTRVALDDPRVFRQEDDPDEKDYRFVFVLDRSSSMGSEIETAERALVTLSRALEELDIDVSIIDMYQSSARLAKPFGVQTENALDRLLTGSTSGSTPLSDVLRVARERVEGADGTPAMIVLTDGQPNNRQTYLDEVQRTNFPVVGVYLALRAHSRAQAVKRFDDSEQLYDRRKIVINESEIGGDLRDLCREIMF